MGEIESSSNLKIAQRTSLVQRKLLSKSFGHHSVECSQSRWALLSLASKQNDIYWHLCAYFISNLRYLKSVDETESSSNIKIPQRRLWVMETFHLGHLGTMVWNVASSGGH